MKFLWPAYRRARYERSRQLMKEHRRDMDQLAAHLRRIGASEAVVHHSCYRIGSPLNSRWIRFKCWLFCDFTRLAILREDIAQRNAR